MQREGGKIIAPHKDYRLLWRSHKRQYLAAKIALSDPERYEMKLLVRKKLFQEGVFPRLHVKGDDWTWPGECLGAHRERTTPVVQGSIHRSVAIANIIIGHGDNAPQEQTAQEHQCHIHEA